MKLDSAYHDSGKRTELNHSYLVYEVVGAVHAGIVGHDVHGVTTQRAALLCARATSLV